MSQIEKMMKIKVCGMKDADNIKAVAKLQPDYMGFIFYHRSPRFAGELDPEALEVISARTVKVGVFVDAPIEYIEDTSRLYSLDAVQLHGSEIPRQCAELRKNLTVIKAFGISCAEDLKVIGDYEGACDFFLFDTKTPLKGGSGLKFDHSILDFYNGNTPFLLSGGIGNGDIVVQKINAMCHGVDVNSRFEISPGIKDIAKLKEFFNEIRKMK